MLFGKIRQPGELPLLVGHRGACDVAPENTLVSFQRALDDGADIVEMDIRLLADGHVVVMHDESVERTTDGTGLIADMDVQSLQRLDAGSWFAPEFVGARIPTLVEVCDWARGKIGIMLEFKFNPFGSFDPALVPAAVKVIQAQGVEEQVVAISYQAKAMQQFKKLLPYARAGVMAPPKRGLTLLSWLARKFPVVNQWPLGQDILLQPLHLAQELGVDLVGPNIRLVSPTLVEAAHQAGFPVSNGGLKWDYPQAIAMGVDTISSNNPGLVRQKFLT